LIVFSARENKAWRFNSAYFHFNPFEADFNVDGIKTFLLSIFADFPITK
jgi:hypothetical protein